MSENFRNYKQNGLTIWKKCVFNLNIPCYIQVTGVRKTLNFFGLIMCNKLPLLHNVGSLVFLETIKFWNGENCISKGCYRK